MSNLVFITLGSNIDPEANLRKAVRLLSRRFTVRAVSHIYETAPIAAAGQISADQANFLNAAVLLETHISPYSLKYGVLRKIEARLGRIRTEDKFAPRTIDLDIALYGGTIMDDPANGIILPDPNSLTHAHVALPLADLAPDFAHPLAGRTLAEIARSLALNEAISRLDIELEEATQSPA